VENQASATKTVMILWKMFLIKAVQDLKHWTISTIFILIIRYSIWPRKLSLICLFPHPSKFTGKTHFSFLINYFLLHLR